MPPIKGKWAQGIKPRNFAWVITDRLAVCERPGGYGANHRKVRRQEEIIWIREQGFTRVISVIPRPTTSTTTTSWRRRGSTGPSPPTTTPTATSPSSCPSCSALLGSGEKLLVHGDELGDRVQGLMAAFLRWTGMIADDPTAVTVIERLLRRQLGPVGRELVALRLVDPRRQVRLSPVVAGVIELRGLAVPRPRRRAPRGARPAPAHRGRLDVHVDIAAAAASDDLADAVDYGAVCDAAVRRGHRRPRRAAGAARPPASATPCWPSTLASRPSSVVVRKLRPPVPHQLATLRRPGPRRAVTR